MAEMKTLTILGNTYKIVDDKARTSIENIEAELTGTILEKPFKMDLSSYKTGMIRLYYADDGIMDVTVTFDEVGNPLSFSNGTDEFTITWPAEEVAESTEEATS